MKYPIRKLILYAVSAALFVQICEYRYNLGNKIENKSLAAFSSKKMELVAENLRLENGDLPLEVYLEDPYGPYSVKRKDCQVVNAASSMGAPYESYVFMRCLVDGQAKMFIAEAYVSRDLIDVGTFYEADHYKYKLSFAKKLICTFAVFLLFVLSPYLPFKRAKSSGEMLEREIADTEEFDRMLAEGRKKRQAEQNCK